MQVVSPAFRQRCFQSKCLQTDSRLSNPVSEDAELSLAIFFDAHVAKKEVYLNQVQPGDDVASYIERFNRTKQESVALAQEWGGQSFSFPLDCKK